MSNPLLIWLEDRQETIVGAKQRVKNKALQSEIFPTFDDFASELEEFKKNDRLSEIGGLIVDVMLYGVVDLTPVVPGPHSTDGGMEAGWVVVEHYLRDPERGFKDLPVLVYSARPLTPDAQKNLDRINRKGGAKVAFLEKTPDWEKAFDRWIDSINKPANPLITGTVRLKSE